jgi:RNA polymerase II subunit A-like phosphatase
MWLFECFSRWTRVDEDAFIIAVEPATAMDENGNDNNIDDARHVASLPADVVVGGGRGEDDLLLPPLEDDDDDLSASTSAAAAAATYDLGLGGASSTVRNGLVDGDGLGEDDGDEDDLPESPIEEMLDEIDWNEFDDEMNEFLDSEGTQDSEAEDDPTTTTTNNKNNNNYNNNNSGNSSSNLSSTNDADITLATRKRKLAVVDDNIAAADAADRPGGSRLEQRKKRAFERTTSLTQVATAEHSSGLPSPEATTGEDKGEAKKRRQIKEEEEADAEMEREMMAAFEDDDEFGDG